MWEDIIRLLSEWKLIDPVNKPPHHRMLNFTNSQNKLYLITVDI